MIFEKSMPNLLMADLTRNHLIINGKCFPYINAEQGDKRFQFTDFIILTDEKINAEKRPVIIVSNKYVSFVNKLK